MYLGTGEDIPSIAPLPPSQEKIYYHCGYVWTIQSATQ